MPRPTRGHAGRRTIPLLLVLGGAVAPPASADAIGRAYLDGDGDGRFGRGDVALAGVPLVLFEDVDRDGRLRAGTDRPVGVALATDASGAYRLPALADGGYLVATLAGTPGPLAGAAFADGDGGVGVVVRDGRAGRAPDVRLLRASVTLDGAATLAPAPSGAAAGFEPRTATATATDAPMTVANNDTVVARPGRTVTVDVLANDVDGVGGGLHIVEVKAPPSPVTAGAVTGDDGIDRLEVVVGPDASGTAAIGYTAADAAGTKASAVLTVEIRPPSGTGEDTGKDTGPGAGSDGDGAPADATPGGGDVDGGSGAEALHGGADDDAGGASGSGADGDAAGAPDGVPGVGADDVPGEVPSDGPDGAAPERRPVLTTSLDGVGAGGTGAASLAPLLAACAALRRRRGRPSDGGPR